MTSAKDSKLKPIALMLLAYMTLAWRKSRHRLAKSKTSLNGICAKLGCWIVERIERDIMKTILFFILASMTWGGSTVLADDAQTIGILAWDETVALKNRDGNGSLPLLTVPESLVSKINVARDYGVVGEVRCENVGSGRYLELQSYFASGESGQGLAPVGVRDMGAGGPMGALVGNQNWREFWLPISAIPGRTKLNSLELRIVGSSAGPIYLRNLRVVQYFTSGKDFSVKNWEIHVTSSWMHGLEYSINGQSYSSVERIKPLLESRRLIAPQDNFTIWPSRNVSRAALDPLGEAVKAAGFEPMFGGPPDEPVLTWLAILEYIGVAGILLLLVAMIIAIVVVQRRNRRARHDFEMRRIASLDS
jgi:hypothetical protein